MKFNSHIYLLMILLASTGCFYSCTSESPFSSEGTGFVRMNVSMNSTMTRADISDDVLQELENKCVVYISDKEGLLHKWVGLSNIPSQIALKYDNYVAEAWSGDSVSASFENKFYKGLTRFSVSESTPNQSVEITCRIANVIVSVNNETIDESVMKNVEVNVSNKAGNLDFAGETLPIKGYFMMPNKDTELKYSAKITGQDGKEVVKQGIIENVVSGHHYRLNFKTDASESTTGGAFFDIIVEDYTEEEAEHIIYGKPAFSWANSSLKVGGQIVHTSDDDPFITEQLRVAAFNGFKSLILETGNMSSYFGGNTRYDLVEVEDDSTGGNLTKLKNYGVEVIKNDIPNSNGLYVWQIIFNKELFTKLAPLTTEYTMTLTAIDKSDKSNSIKIRVANTTEAIRYEDPIVINFKEFNADLTAVNATSATIPITIVDNSKDFALLYRVENSGSWNKKPIVTTKADNEITVSLTGLTENTTYEYKVVAGAEQDGVYEFESDSNTFKTESKFTIPNASMEDWFLNGKIWEPHPESNYQAFWDTGNKGTTMAGFTATQGSDEFHASGTMCAKLHTQYKIKLGAGNLFVGEFGSITGLSGASVNFGRPYNGSHPKALKVYAKYVPQIIDHYDASTPDPEVQQGILDHGQIFIALTTQVYTVDTNKKQYFDPDNECVLGYGEITWKDAFGAGNGLEEQIINIIYKEKAKTVEPTHLIIVASASKFGDYFTGAAGSVMYVDDFELVY